MFGEATENPPAVGTVRAWTGPLGTQFRFSLSRASPWKRGAASSKRPSSENFCVDDLEFRNGRVATEAVIALAALKHDGQFHLVVGDDVLELRALRIPVPAESEGIVLVL